MKRGVGWLLLVSGLALAACGGETAVLAPATPTPIGYRAGWQLSWHDEFDGPEIDAANWTQETGGNGWGNAELQFYTNKPDNAFIEDGHLVIQALQQNHQGRKFTSARMITKEKFEQAYGRFEARLKIPHEQGVWPAFWTLGGDIDEVGWPQCGEIDIMENIGSEPAIVHGTVHGPGYSGANGVGAAYSLPDGRSFTDDFHIYAIEWESTAIRWYVDDILTNTITTDDVPGKWVYDHPVFILLNVAVGGYWPGSPDDTTVFPQRMLVDYVRVYERP